MKNPIIYVLINGSLSMSPGKVAAQTAHAVASLHAKNPIDDFSDEVVRIVIVLESKNQSQMYNLKSYLDNLNIPVGVYIDEGINEVDAYSTTAMAVGPICQSDYEKRVVFQEFPLYNGSSKKKWYKRLFRK